MRHDGSIRGAQRRGGKAWTFGHEPTNRRLAQLPFSFTIIHCKNTTLSSHFQLQFCKEDKGWGKGSWQCACEERGVLFLSVGNSNPTPCLIANGFAKCRNSIRWNYVTNRWMESAVVALQTARAACRSELFISNISEQCSEPGPGPGPGRHIASASLNSPINALLPSRASRQHVPTTAYSVLLPTLPTCFFKYLFLATFFCS